MYMIDSYQLKRYIYKIDGFNAIENFTVYVVVAEIVVILWTGLLNQYHSIFFLIYSQIFSSSVLAWHILGVLYSLYESIDGDNGNNSKAISMRAPARPRAAQTTRQPNRGRGRTTHV